MAKQVLIIGLSDVDVHAQAESIKVLGSWSNEHATGSYSSDLVEV